MSIKGELTSSRSLVRLAQAERVKELLKTARTIAPDEQTVALEPVAAPPQPDRVPLFAVAIDGSYVEHPVRNGYPGASVGYVTVAGVLLNLKELEKLDEHRPVDPTEFRKTEKAATIDAALPGSNVVTGDHPSAQSAFREALFNVLEKHEILEGESTLLDTFNELLSLKPSSSKAPKCPREDCEQEFHITEQTIHCICERQCRIYSTDALRIHDRFNEVGSNGEAFGLVMQVWERVLLLHLLKLFEPLEWLKGIGQLIFLVEGPLAVFGPPAWLSAAISTELKRLNEKVRQCAGNDMMLVGIETSGAFVTHFEEIDQSETAGVQRFAPRSYFLLTDEYIKQRIAPSDSTKRFGAATYFGRKFFYKTSSGARIVANIPFLSEEQDTLKSNDISLYPQFAAICSILDRLASSRAANALSPIISAHAHAAIPIKMGKQVLQQLARTMMEQNR
jgi:NurA domain